MLLAANLGAYEKTFIPFGANEQTVLRLLGRPSKVEKIYSSNPQLEGVCLGEKWFYYTAPLNLTWIEMNKELLKFGPNEPLFFERSDVKFSEEVLKVKKGLFERMTKGDIQIQDVSLRLEYVPVHSIYHTPFFQLKFSHVNKRNESIAEVTFHIELVDDEGSPVSSNSRTIEARSCRPDMKNSVNSSVPVDFPNSGIVKLPRFLRFSAYDSAGKKLSLADGLYEIVEPK